MSDSLIASNGLIHPKMVGKLRFLDSRDDEQVSAWSHPPVVSVHGEPPTTPTAVDADLPVAHGPSVHTSGETQTLEARGRIRHPLVRAGASQSAARCRVSVTFTELIPRDPT
jgi:hypothetical protein